MESTQRPSVWLQLYFVLATMLGLIFIVIGASTYLTTTLQETYFKPKPPTRSAPPEPYMSSEAYRLMEDGKILTDDETKLYLESWRKDYEAWQNQEQEYDWEAENRKSTMAWSLAMLIVGLPVFAIHAPFIFLKMRRM